MEIKLTLNGKPVTASIDADTLLIDFVRDHGCYSVKRGCETANCGLCTVLMDGTPVLSCSVLAARAAGHHVQTLEGLQDEAEDFVGFIADQGAEQCGFCNPGFVMNTIALLRENPDPTDDEIRAYLAGNLCRCSGYEGQLRGIRAYLDSRKGRRHERKQIPRGQPAGAQKGCHAAPARRARLCGRRHPARLSGGQGAAKPARPCAHRGDQHRHRDEGAGHRVRVHLKDVPQKRFTMAGQTFPEPSPYDRLILDQRVRFVGDAVAIVAGESEKAVDKALKKHQGEISGA